jgi:hypothetical protein
MVEIVLCCRLQFGDGTIAIVLFGWYYSDGNSRFAIGMVEIAHCCRLQLMMVQEQLYYVDGAIGMKIVDWHGRNGTLL